MWLAILMQEVCELLLLQTVSDKRLQLVDVSRGRRLVKQVGGTCVNFVLFHTGQACAH
jgi:hypothetical protein